jgi:superoxide dismutase
MRIHHDKHHGSYVAELNAALEGTEWADWPVEQLLPDLAGLPEDERTAVRNNAGGRANHSLFWQVIAPNTTSPAQRGADCPATRGKGATRRSRPESHARDPQDPPRAVQR